MKRHPSEYAARSSDGRFVRRKRRAAPRYPPSTKLIADWHEFYRPLEKSDASKTETQAGAVGPQNNRH